MKESVNYIYNLIILDESGSMDDIRFQALTGVNETIQTIRQAQQENPDDHQMLSFVTREDVAKKVKDELAGKYAERSGGYTRITRIGARRGDAAEMAVIELV